MRIFFLIVGFLILCVGLFWVGQGLGYINWPASSFMLSKIKWAYYGGGLAVVGLLIIWFSRRLK